MKSKQTGLTLMSFLVVLALVGFAAFIGMKLFPMYQRGFAVRSCLKALANEGGEADKDPEEIKNDLFKRFDIAYVDDSIVKRDNVKVEKGDGGYVVNVDYEERVELVYNLDMVGKFDFKQPVGGHSTY